MRNLLFIGHVFHQKTKSSDFLLEQLRCSFNVTELYLEPQELPIGQISSMKTSRFDVLVVWQIMPEIPVLKRFLAWDYGAFFPMYDHFLATGELYPMTWKHYADFIIICFSKKLHEVLKASGFDSKYIQYFPKPKKIEEWGNEKSLFFWQRKDVPNLQMLMSFAKPLQLQHIHIHQVPDPGFYSEPYSTELTGFHITSTQWFKKKEEMFCEMGKSAYYMAPRLYEGIGLSFLDAMSMGRCVIAPDTPTMNEYIVNGENGFLYPWDDGCHEDIQLTIPHHTLREMQTNAYHTIEQGYKEWMDNRQKIVDWCLQKPCPNAERIKESSMAYGWNDDISHEPCSKVTQLMFALYIPEMKYVAQKLLGFHWRNLLHFFIVHLSSRFNRKWYIDHYSNSLKSGVAPASHYLQRGWKEGKNPSPSFFTNLYIKNHPEIMKTDLCPLVHRKIRSNKK